MPDNLFETQTEQLTQLAQAWQARGAKGMCLHTDGQTIWQWPVETLPAEPDITADVVVEGTAVATLGVIGCSSKPDQIRLRSDARLLGHTLGLEKELEMMTGEFIEMQDQLLALYDLTQSTRSHLELPNALQSVTAEVARLIKVKGAFAILQAPPDWPQLLIHSTDCLINESDILNLFEQVQATGEELLLQGENTAALRPTEVRNLLLVPIRVQGEIQIGLGLINRLLGDFQSPDLKLIRAIAEQVGSQIENALLLHETLKQARLQTEMNLAKEVQLQLLPQHPLQVSGLDIYARSVPALQVGGDFYDFIYGADQKLTFTVGDVSGKGVSSALIMAMIRTVMRSASNFAPDRSPQALLDRTNQDLYDDFTDVMMFATVFAGQYDPHSRLLTYSNAGHSPVIFVPAGEKARMLEASGTAIGVLPENMAVNETLTLAVGDVLVIATDGFSEARCADGRLFGYAALQQLVQDNCHQSAREIAEMLYTAVSNFATGHPQDDDQTLIVVKGI
ncbi:MAG: SpoIIE family protein phosphatase [Anaerolineales bacterium]|nr:SpoIIE family protein phosphatase [Anaerolineales bacterium]